MRATIFLSALALILSLAPASAMCGGGQQTQASTSGQGGMMCGRPAAAAADNPFGDKPDAQSQSSQKPGMGMCPCCRGMASMGSGMKMDGDMHKGMDMPKQ